MSERPKDLRIGCVQFRCEADGTVWASLTPSMEAGNFDMTKDHVGAMRDWSQAVLDYKPGSKKSWIPGPGECFAFKHRLTRAVYRRSIWSLDPESFKREIDGKFFMAMELETGLMIKVLDDNPNLVPVERWEEAARLKEEQERLGRLYPEDREEDDDE